MKSILFFVFIISCFTAFGQAEAGQSEGTRTVENELRKANSNDIVRVEVIYFPEDIETEFAVKPVDLEKGYWAKTTIADFERSKFRSSFLHSLATSNIQNRKGGARDLRWACILYDSKDTRVVSLYFDKFGDGEVNGIQIESNGKLLELLRQKFAFR